MPWVLTTGRKEFILLKISNLILASSFMTGPQWIHRRKRQWANHWRQEEVWSIALCRACGLRWWKEIQARLLCGLIRVIEEDDVCEKSEDGPNNSACSGKTERWKVLKKEKKYQFSRNVQCILMDVTKRRQESIIIWDPRTQEWKGPLCKWGSLNTRESFVGRAKNPRNCHPRKTYPACLSMKLVYDKAQSLRQ